MMDVFGELGTSLKPEKNFFLVLGKNLYFFLKLDREGNENNHFPGISFNFFRWRNLKNRMREPNGKEGGKGEKPKE